MGYSDDRELLPAGLPALPSAQEVCRGIEEIGRQCLQPPLRSISEAMISYRLRVLYPSAAIVGRPHLDYR
jgi:hypothetical protein